jgi:hypothetical protein
MSGHQNHTLPRADLPASGANIVRLDPPLPVPGVARAREGGPNMSAPKLPPWPILEIIGRKGTEDYDVEGFDRTLAICRFTSGAHRGRVFRWPITELPGSTSVEQAHLLGLAANQQGVEPCPCPECSVHDGGSG